MPSETLRVALTIGPPGPGGIGAYNRELAAALARRDDLDLVTVGSEAAHAELATPPTRHIRLRGGRLAEQAVVAAFGPVLRRHRVDVVHGTRHVLPLGVAAPRVLTFHDDYALTRRHEYDLVKRLTILPAYRWSLAAADAIVALAPSTAELAARHIGPDVPVVVTGAAVATDLVDAVPVEPRVTLPHEYALVVGDASPRKQVDRLLDVWPDVERSCGLALVVAGGRAATTQLVDRLEREAVTFVRLPTAGELSHLYRHAAVVVDAAADEGFGFTRVEASHFGVAHVTLRERCGAPSVDRVATIASAIADRRVDATHPDTWDDVAERTVDVYRRLIEERGR